jgi:glyoxylase-like metal-dependent hydrolase (beta-lactamase superfamily II)
MTERPQPPVSDEAGAAAPVTAEGHAYPSAAQRLQFLEIVAPTPGSAVRVAPGIWWARIPLPIDLDHINVWLLETPAGYVIVDTGMAADIAKVAWQQIDAQLLQDRRVCAVLVTHIHPDHLGLAAWLQQRHGVPVLMSKRTAQQVQTMLGAAPDNAAEMSELLRKLGVAEPLQARTLLTPQRFARMISGTPNVTQYVADGQVLPWNSDTWTALETGGHAEGHLCLYDCAQRLLISGDQVLPSISPNIGLNPHNQDLNPLDTYLRSLERLRRLDRDTLVLPSHGHPFYGLRARIDDLRRHHLEQLERLVSECHTARSVAELLPVMFRRVLKGMHLMLAVSEALAHLEYLVYQSRLRRVMDAAGVARYVATDQVSSDEPDLQASIIRSSTAPG